MEIKRVRTPDGVVTHVDSLVRSSEQAFRAWVIAALCRSGVLIGYDETGQPWESNKVIEQIQEEKPETLPDQINKNNQN